MTSKASTALCRADDPPHMQEVVRWAEGERLPICRPSPYQLKIGPWNYYPTRMTFNTDALPAQKRAGFAAFREAVLGWRRQLRETEAAVEMLGDLAPKRL